ncbi:putative late blight resistance protein-like protein R1B-16 [Forsythia ovata]|uniref:Late blight resistance protein-like protein R1B-16 n=1 Tax=Forsythia ovata TaxID=205694 RepID=A0ABD1WP44_9LAMI
MYQQRHCLSFTYRASPINSLPFGLHVRSLLCAYLQSPTFISSSFKVLRVLDVHGSSVYHVVIGSENLVHLRYLAISCKLPPMGTFHRLECLVVDTMDVVEISEVLLNMLSLRHMQFNGGAYFSASCCRQATNDESFQINNNLQSISWLKISDETDEKILRSLPNLRRLKAKLGTSLNYSFDCLTRLESLKLSPDYSNAGDSCYSLINLPVNLKKLTLFDVHVSRKQMEIIGRLLKLEVLKLLLVAFEGRQWGTSEDEFPTSEDEFPQLKFLKLDDVQLAEWNASSDNFPRLQRLVLRHCNHLKRIPSGLGDIPMLQKIEVYQCSQAIKDSAKLIQEEQQEMENEDLKIIISD